MTKIIKLIIGIIVVLLLCVGGFTYYNSTRQTSPQANPNINPVNTNLDKSKNSTGNNKDKKDIDSKKAIEPQATVKTNSTASTSNTNNNASNKVQEAPVRTKNNSNVNTSNYNNATSTIVVPSNKNNNESNNNNNSKSELASLKTQCTNAFSSIENEVNQINNQPNSDSYQITEQQNHIYNLWNNQLNYMYQKLEAILPHSTFETLNNSEVSWINYKINESSKFSDAGGSGGGAMRYYYKDAQLTKERCYYLYNNYIK